MKDVISRIKNKINICSVVAPHTNGLRPSNGNKFLKGHCPYCQPHGSTKSRPGYRFWVNTQSQTCGCHKCTKDGHSMDVINFYAWIYDISDLDAMQELEGMIR